MDSWFWTLRLKTDTEKNLIELIFFLWMLAKTENSGPKLLTVRAHIETDNKA